MPLLLGPVLVVDCYLLRRETWDGWSVGSVMTTELPVTLPACHQS